MSKRDFFKAQAKSIIKELREAKDIPYADLAKSLRDGGWAITEKVLINRVNRGTYSFAFALQLLEILGTRTIELPKSSQEPLNAAKGGPE